jgi:two-component system chemotaxis response regulator CheB
MSDKTIRVLVVDDSAFYRQLLSDLIGGVPGLEVVGTARDGADALRRLPMLRPDIITLDVQMPRMDGLVTLEAILIQCPTPVIMVSSQTQRAADTALEALDRGALDYIAKPEYMDTDSTSFRDELIHKLRMMAGADVQRLLRIRSVRKQRLNREASQRKQHRIHCPEVLPDYQTCCVAIGISTGGPPALSSVFQALTPPLPPIVVVQHMPAKFTESFARRLDSISALSVREARTGDRIEPNCVLIAPGGRHLSVRRQQGDVVAQVREGELVSGHQPSVDVMMRSVIDVFGSRCLGVIMTGMGHDGASGCGMIRAAGGYVLGQDEASSDVYGMNKVAFASGHVDRQFRLDELPQLITRQCRTRFIEKTEPHSVDC